MKRGHYKAEAVVLNAFDYGESDAILTLYTKEYGKFNGIAKYGRKSKRRFVGTLDPLAHIRFDFFAGGRSDLVRLESARLIDGFPSMKGDIASLSQGSYFVELVGELTREGQPSGDIFSLLTDFLSLLDRGGDPLRLSRGFEIRLLDFLGYMPRIDGCVGCGKGEGRVFFSTKRGGMVCAGCARGATSGLIPFSLGTARFLAAAARFDIEKLKRLAPTRVVVSEAEGVLDSFIQYLTGKELRSRRFMKRMAEHTSA